MEMVNFNDMKRIFRTLLTIAVATMPLMASAQKAVDPVGYVTYSLPSTTLVLDVEAVQESFYCGPYARYAEKYLGIKVRQKDEVTYRLTGIGMVPYVEADLSRRYTVALKKGAPDLAFLKLSAAGLVAFADGGFAGDVSWRFPVEKSGDFAAKGVSSNLTSEATTLYRNERKESAYSRVAVQQNMVVEKTLEQKAAEAAYLGEQACVETMRQAFERRRDLVISLVKEIKGLKVSIPDGAFYVFPECNSYFGKKTPKGDVIANANDLAMYILMEGHVACVSGDAFGDKNCIRMSYATSEENIKEAFRRIKECLDAIK